MKLYEIARVIRSKNAGPYWYTVDVIFDNRDFYEAVKASNIITKELVAKQYANLDVSKVSDVIWFDEGCGFKINIQRPYSSGSPFDYDVLGMNQHAPMREIDIPLYKLFPAKKA